MKKFVASLLLIITPVALATPQVNLNSSYMRVNETNDLVISASTKNVYMIVGPILNGLDDGADLGPIAISMKQNLEKKEEVVLLINSPGGIMEEVTYDFLDTMDKFKEEGVPVTCVVNGMAASLAAIIFSKCSNRYSLPSSRILWHSIATNYNGKLNEQMAKEIYERFHELNEKFWAETKKFFSEEYFLKNFNEENLMVAIELEKQGKGYLKVVRSVKLPQ